MKRGRSDSPTLSSEVYWSQSKEDTKSTFVAAFSPSLSVKSLQRLPEFTSATHRIAAWRKRSRQKSLVPKEKTLWDLGHDDDGEKWAGSRLEHVLSDAEAEGVVVVARWYGGVNIGPIRFTHIESTAKEAIWMWKLSDKEAKQEEAVKKQRVEEETTREELIKTLQERDSNIFTMREHLAKRKAELENSAPAPLTPQRAVDYSKMTMAALKTQEKVKDKTIAFILKKFDELDEQEKLAAEANDDSQLR